MAGNVISSIAMRPVTFFILLTIAVLLLPSIVIPYWYNNMVKSIEQMVEKEAKYARPNDVITKIEDTTKLIPSFNSSTANLAKTLGSLLDVGDLTFDEIQTKVAPMLFEVQSIMPQITQASYIGLDGLFFSYILDENNTYAIFSNSSFPINSTYDANYTWYTLLANSSTGVLYGKANITRPFTVLNETWFLNAMKSPSGVASSSVGFQWTRPIEEEPGLFIATAKLGLSGAISLGLPIDQVSSVFSSTNLHGASLYLSTVDGGIVIFDGVKEASIKVQGDKVLVHYHNDVDVGEILCRTNKNKVANFEGTTLNIGGTNVIFTCSSIEIAGTPLAYVLAFPSNEIVTNVHKHIKVALILMIVMMIAMVISIFSFVALIVRAARREVHLCAAYMKQTEMTSQAERKSIKQSLAFASANHDVRGYLACIKGLIELIINDVSPSSELASNLRKIDDCAEDLLGLVNSILDFSKIEAGKMQLEDGEFDLAQLLEDVADLHHPVAMKKGVDVILDPSDGSIMNFSKVRGDRGKLKQILSNLLSNAVKFTSEGYISIRAKAKKLSFESSIITSSSDNSLLNKMSRFFTKNKGVYNDLDEMRSIKQDPNCMEFVFEVEDTGPGIPNDKRSSIFENFVQVKENSAGQIGTGLGLGIVQSLVRLMGGDIEVVDKIDGKRGTCFRFNIFLIVQGNAPSSDHIPWMCSPTPERSLVVLLINNDERRRTIRRYMKSLGINVVSLKQGSQLHDTLERIKTRLHLSQQSHHGSSSGRSSDSSARFPRMNFAGACLGSSGSSLEGGRDGAKIELLSETREVKDDTLPVHNKGSGKPTMKSILLIIDANAGDFHKELSRSVAHFRRDIPYTCVKVVWLDRRDTRKAHFHGMQDENLPYTDQIMLDPLHGSRLTRVIALLPEFGGMFPTRSYSIVSRSKSQIRIEELAGSGGEIQEIGIAKNEASTIKNNSKGKSIVDAEQKPSASSEKPLVGKRFLIAEDNPILSKLAKTSITRWGADHTEVCRNGQEAFEVVCKALTEMPSTFPFDYILMDCQMPIMDGFEATRRIRDEEGKYGIRIPIIALTANEVGEEGENIVEAGMDYHLTKPLKLEDLLQAINSLRK